MKSFAEIIIIISCLLLSAFAAEAATPLTSCAHNNEVSYTPIAKGKKLKMMGDYSATSGFSLGRGGGYLIAPEKTGKVTFRLRGKYSK